MRVVAFSRVGGFLGGNGGLGTGRYCSGQLLNENPHFSQKREKWGTRRLRFHRMTSLKSKSGSPSQATDRSVRPTRVEEIDRYGSSAENSRFLTGLGARFGMTSL
jgi:hypothetical protein